MNDSVRMTPLRIGITGGIGSGKSVVSRLLALMGIPVYLSDDAGKRLLATDDTIRRELTALLGAEAYVDGLPNKPLLAAYLFASADHAGRVNAIVHPCVRRDFRRWVAAQGAVPLVAIESAILIEAGFAPEVDVVVMVDAPLEVRVARAMRRDSSTRESIEQRIRRQMADDEKRRQAHYILHNDGRQALLPQVLSLIGTLSKNNAYLCGE